MPRRLARRTAASVRRAQPVAWPEPEPSVRRAVRPDVAAQPRAGFARPAAQRWVQHWEFAQRAAARPDGRKQQAAVPVRTVARCEALCLPGVAAAQRQAAALRDVPQAAAELRTEPFAVAVALPAVLRLAAAQVELRAAVPRLAAVAVRVEPQAAAEPEEPVALRAAGPAALLPVVSPRAAPLSAPPASSSARLPACSFGRASSSGRASPFPVRARRSWSPRSPEATRHRTEPCRP